MSIILFCKAHIPAYTKKDGTHVPAHETHAPGAKIKTKPATPAATRKASAVKAAPAAKSSADYKAALSKYSTSPKGESGQGSLLKPRTKPSYLNAAAHPQPGADGAPFQINEPSQPTGEETWAAPDEIAQFVPGGTAPAELHGIPLVPWTDHPKTVAGWEFVPGQMYDLDEPEMDAGRKAPAAGVIVIEADGRVWMVKPSNGFAGYKTTFPKGHADDGLTLQQTAIKEAFEESGLQVEITGLIGDVERGQTMTRYYSAKRVGGTPTACGWETQAVVLAPQPQIHSLLNRAVDRVVAHAAGIEPPIGFHENADHWERVGKQAGSNPGGVFKDGDGQEWYMKVPKSADIAKNEVLAANLYAAAGIAVPEVKNVMVLGELGVASKMIRGLKPDVQALKNGEVPGVLEGFAVDAWLANWDVVGLLYDNLLVDAKGHGVRVDTGGSLIFRAQGSPKGAAFGDTVGELKTLVDGKNLQATAVFGHITPKELAASIAKVAKVSDKTIRELCEAHGPGSKRDRADLARKLILRKKSMLSA